MTVRAPSRPATVQARCKKADTHGASCMLPALHPGPCFVAPLEPYSLVSDADFDALTGFKSESRPVGRSRSGGE